MHNGTAIKCVDVDMALFQTPPLNIGFVDKTNNVFGRSLTPPPPVDVDAFYGRSLSCYLDPTNCKVLY